MAKSKSKLGDTRLERVHGLLIYAMSQKMSVVLRQLGETKTEEVAFGRFINNPKVNPERVLSQYHQIEPVDFTGKHILVVQDSSSAAFGLHSNREDLGYVGEKTNKTGFDMHPAIYMDANDGACYGLGGLKVWKTAIIQTEEEEEAKVERRKNTWKIPFEEKETFKWYSTAKQAITNNKSADRYTIVGDREADIYDLLARCHTEGWDFLVRNRQQRKVSDARDQINNLYSAIESWPIKMTYELDLPRTEKRTAHKATLEVKFNSLEIVRPKYHRDKTLPETVPVYVVEVKEIEATVVGNEKAIHWVLLTSHPVKDIGMAMRIIQWYRWRWVIEQVFRTLKTKGLNIEKSEVESYQALVNLATLALIAAVQILQLVQARDGQTKQEIKTMFSQMEVQCLVQLNKKLEGTTEKSKNPHPPKSLAFASWIIARLGGWKGYKKARPPGPITMLRGLIRFFDILKGFNLLL